MARREFTPLVYAQIVKRAMLSTGEIACEGCGLVLGKKPYQVDHTKADGLEVDKSRKLTAEDGKLLGLDCCHKPKSAQDVKVIAQAKRREAKHLGIKKPAGKLKGQGFPKFGKVREPKPDFTQRRPLFALSSSRLWQPLSRSESHDD